MNDEIRQLAKVDRIVHEPGRLMIMALLYGIESAEFRYLLYETGLSKGNLSAHLSRLEEAGYVKIEKSFRGKIPHTACCLTEAGREAFSRYRAQLRRTAERLPG